MEISFAFSGLQTEIMTYPEWIGTDQPVDFVKEVIYVTGSSSVESTSVGGTADQVGNSPCPS